MAVEKPTLFNLNNMSKEKALVIDGDNLLHRAYHKFKRMSSKSGQPSSMVYGFPFILKSLIDTQKPTEVLVVFDGGRHKARLEAWPEYKGTRKDRRKGDFDMEDFVYQKEDVIKILSYLGIPVVRKRHYEADDIIWLYSRRKKRKGSVVIVSTDKDFNQLLSPNLSIWHPWKGKRITHKNVKEIYGYKPEDCVTYLSLVGDKSDNIPGANGIGHKRALDFIDKYGSLNKYRLGAGEEMNKFTRREAEELFYRNRTLIDLRFFCRRHLDLKKIPLRYKKGKKINQKELALICSKYSISTFTKERFLKTYKNLLKNE